MSKVVLVAVLKNRRDLSCLLCEKWYRIPVDKCPQKKFIYLAFFEPAKLPGQGGRIRYFAEPARVEVKNRKTLLPAEKDSEKKYFQFTFDCVKKLKNQVKNKNGMRVSFGFTTLQKLLKAKEVTDLFDVAPIEKLIRKALQLKELKAYPEYPLRLSATKRVRLDFAVFCRKGALNIECDSTGWHSTKRLIIADKTRDRDLRKLGWSILRLKEAEITGNISKSVEKVVSRVKTLGGIVEPKMALQDENKKWKS